MEARLPNKIRFDAWTLDTQSGDLTKGEVTTRLQIQPLQILLALLENPGNLVSREQLIARLWPKGIVEFDTSLNTAVRKLRIALSDDSDNPRFIDTIPRRGYRFIAKIEPEQAPVAPVAEIRADISGESHAVPRPKRARIFVAAALLLIFVAAGFFYWNDRPTFGTPALVVLPMVDMSAEQKDVALCRAVTEAISNRLAQLPTVRVVSRTMAMKYEGKNEDVREIGKSLGATYVVESSVRRDQKALRGTVQLVSAADGYHLYSQSFDFAVENLQDIEQTLSQSVAQAVRLLLSPELVRQSQANAGPQLRGIRLLHTRAQVWARGYPGRRRPGRGAISACDRTRSAIRARVRRTGRGSSRHHQQSRVAGCRRGGRSDAVVGRRRKA